MGESPPFFVAPMTINFVASGQVKFILAIDQAALQPIYARLDEILQAVSVSQETQQKIDALTAQLTAKAGQLSQVVSDNPNT